MSVSFAESRQIATRYAQALLDYAAEQKAVDVVLQEISALAEACRESEDLRRFVQNPLLSRDAQMNAMDALLGKASAETKQLVRVLVENRRLAMLPFVAEVYGQLVAESRNETIAQVVAAKPLSKEQVKALEAELKKATGRKAVHIVQREDASLLGGFTVNVDGRMLDASLAGKLNRLARGLEAQA